MAALRWGLLSVTSDEKVMFTFSVFAMDNVAALGHATRAGGPGEHARPTVPVTWQFL